VYLVIIILIVTWLKDMVVSMYHKIKNKQWSTNTFSKAKQSGEAGEAVKLNKSKIVEGFTGVGVFPTTCDVIPALTATSFPSICDKLKFLLCNDNFEKLRRLLVGTDDIPANMKSLLVDTDNFEKLKRLLLGITTTHLVGFQTLPLNNNGFNLNTSGGNILTASGNIFTSGGNINTNGSTMTGSIYTGSITAPNINVTNLYAIGTDMNTRKIEVHDHITLGGKILYVKHLQMINEGEIFMDIRNINGFVVARFTPPKTNSDYSQLVVWKNDNINYKYVALKDGTGIAD
jgi:hypothetical protein